MIKRRVMALATFVFVVFAINTPVFAAPYGESTYGKCAYQTSCPAPPMETPPPPGAPTPPDTDPDPLVEDTDIDNDGNNEQAIDADGNPANGYEQFVDPDGSSQVLAATDGENNGTTSFIIDTDGDGEPDIYWSPSDEYSAIVRVDVNGTDIVWVYENADGQLQYYASGQAVPVDKPQDQAPQVATAETRITSNDFGGELYKKAGELAQKVPAPGAYSFPYILLLLLFILVLRLLLQTKQELLRMKVIISTTEREKQLVLEKQNFLMLASHYLRTPVTIIKGNIELAQSLKTIPENALQALNTSAAAMQTEINNLLETITHNENLNQIIPAQTKAKSFKQLLFSPFVILPLAALLAVIGFINFLFIDFRVTEPKLIDFLVQFLLVVILGQWFISSFRKRHINKQNRLDQQKVLDEERNLDEARSNFITVAIQALSDKVQTFDQQLVTLSGAGHDVSRLRKGFDQLKEMITKFSFATGLRAMAVEANKTKIDSAETIASVAQRVSEKAAARNIPLQSQVQGGQFTQNQQLLSTVLDSLADNAVKYSPENAPVTMMQRQEGQNVYFAVEDRGPGLTKEQLDLLFKPFSRAESAETFNTEGLGFSLYLDRLIAHYLGGDIEIHSVPNQSTIAQLSLPGA